MKRSHWILLATFSLVNAAFAQEELHPIDCLRYELAQPVTYDPQITYCMSRLYFGIHDGSVSYIPYVPDESGETISVGGQEIPLQEYIDSLFNEMIFLLSNEQELMDEVDMADLMTIMEDIRYELVP